MNNTLRIKSNINIKTVQNEFETEGNSNNFTVSNEILNSFG